MLAGQCSPLRGNKTALVPPHSAHAGLPALPSTPKDVRFKLDDPPSCAMPPSMASLARPWRLTLPRVASTQNGLRHLSRLHLAATTTNCTRLKRCCLRTLLLSRISTRTALPTRKFHIMTAMFKMSSSPSQAPLETPHVSTSRNNCDSTDVLASKPPITRAKAQFKEASVPRNDEFLTLA
jgi:hypothetical protein